MSNKERIQINVNISPGQREQLDALVAHYGSISAAVRVALDVLHRDLIRSGQIRPTVLDHYAEHADTDASPQVNELDA